MYSQSVQRRVESQISSEVKILFIFLGKMVRTVSNYHSVCISL